MTKEHSPEETWSHAPFGPVEERVHVLRDLAADHELRNVALPPRLIRVLAEDIDRRLEDAHRLAG